MALPGKGPDPRNFRKKKNEPLSPHAQNVSKVVERKPSWRERGLTSRRNGRGKNGI